MCSEEQRGEDLKDFRGLIDPMQRLEMELLLLEKEWLYPLDDLLLIPGSSTRNHYHPDNDYVSLPCGGEGAVVHRVYRQDYPPRVALLPERTSARSVLFSLLVIL